MKKGLFTIALIGGLSLSSCTGTFDCVCENKTTGDVATADTYVDVKKSDVQEDCDGWESLITAFSTDDVECKLKKQ